MSSKTNTPASVTSTYPTDLVLAFVVFLACLMYALFEKHEWLDLLASHP